MVSNDPPSKPPINPFDAARARASSDVTVVWTAADVQSIRPDWSPRECEEFLRLVANRFAPGLLRIGLSLLQALSIDPRWGGKIGHRPEASEHQGEASPDS